MVMISELKKKSTIAGYVSFLNSSHVNVSDDVIKSTQYRRKRRTLHTEIKYIRISEHALSRWNERVGPAVKEEDLVPLMNQLLWVPGSIQLMSDEQGIVDGDIVFTYYMEDDCLCITTFYGRISLHPPLSNFAVLQKYNKQENDSYNLSVPINILNKQNLPLIPNEIIRVKGNKNMYQVEKYYSHEGNECCLYLYRVATPETSFMKINLSNPQGKRLNNSTLHALSVLGYTGFVLQHLRYHEPEAYNRSMLKELFKKIESPILYTINYCLQLNRRVLISYQNSI